MRDFAGTILGKLIRLGLAFRRRGGQALPGLIIESLFPGYVPSMLQRLPEGVVIITGTNGKTTTTKIVVEILKSQGKRVLTNSTGSNLVRGIASSLSQHAKLSGKLPFDMAVLEVDEATARLLVRGVKPRWVVGLNVSRDQLDRFGEVDTIAGYVGDAMSAATEGIVTNAGDPHLLKQASSRKVPVHFFGAAKSLSKFFPNDYELAAVDKNLSAPEAEGPIEVELSAFSGRAATYKVGGKQYQSELKLTGQHNFLNGAAALALCRQLLPETPVENLVQGLSNVSLAFGRGEKYILKNGTEIELVLVKNPASFTQALSSYSGDANLMIAINDNIADGRDVSWLWDVNFSPLTSQKIALTSGSRAVDIALRLQYDDIKVSTIEPDLAKAVRLLSDQSGPKIILSTYTAMLQLYKLLSGHGRRVL
ncbi:MAG TPA: MurT ligase domain-containing protein [Candidatus Saccharimonadales bacterium]|nr:MurT ligase domain-containing protein [Candidatus Saccharimonadales bacterium]